MRKVVILGSRNLEDLERRRLSSNFVYHQSQKYLGRPSTTLTNPRYYDKTSKYDQIHQFILQDQKSDQTLVKRGNRNMEIGLPRSGKSVASQKMENSEHYFGEVLSRKKKEEEIALQSS